MNRRRVVITGLGPVTPIGAGKDDFWNSLLEGKTNFSEITRFSLTKEDKCRIAAQISDLQVHRMYVLKNDLMKNTLDVSVGLERSLTYAFAAAHFAIRDSNLKKEDLANYKTGVIIGDTNSNFNLVNDSASIRTLPYLLSNSLSGVVASYYGIQGFSTSISGACATGNHAVRAGFKEIRDADADLMIVGASSAPIERPHMYDDFSDPILKNGIMSISNDLKYAMKPFSKNRDGFALSEGAGILVLEELTHARKRGAHVYAEVLGYGDATDIGTNFAKSSQKGYSDSLALAIGNSLDFVDLNKEKVYVNAHGTATKLNDLIESNAILSQLPKRTYVSSLKGFTGHSQGAASAIELIASALILDAGYIPGMPWLKNEDIIDKNVNYVIDPIRQRPDIVLKNAAGFFGVYSTIALGRAD